MFSVYPMVKQYPATDKLDKYNIARYNGSMRQEIARETFMGKLRVRAIVSHRLVRGDSFYGLSFEFASGRGTVAVGTRFYSSKTKVSALQEIVKNPPTLSEIMERTDFSHLSEGFKLAIFNPLRLEVNDLVESIRQDKELYKHLKWLDSRYPSEETEEGFDRYVNLEISPPDKLNIRGMNFEGVYPIMKAILYRQLILMAKTCVKERRSVLYHRAALWSTYIMDYNNTEYYLNDLQRTRRNVMLLKLLSRNIFYYAELVKGLSRYRTLDINGNL